MTYKQNRKQTVHMQNTGKRPKKKFRRSSGVFTAVVMIVLSLFYLYFAKTSDIAESPVAVGNREAVELVRVVDGDTIIVSCDNENIRVRLIGINAPESVHEDASKNTQEGRDSSTFLKEYLKNTDTVWLEFDEEIYDQYDRVLAYVWMTADGTDVGEDMLNGIIVKNGYAEARVYEPNDKYATELSRLMP